MFQFLLTPHSLRQLKKLPERDQIRIKKKLHFWSKNGNALEFAKPLVNFEFATTPAEADAGEAPFLGEFEEIFLRGYNGEIDIEVVANVGDMLVDVG